MSSIFPVIESPSCNMKVLPLFSIYVFEISTVRVLVYVPFELGPSTQISSTLSAFVFFVVFNTT
jgi:hypothetical protein